MDLVIGVDEIVSVLERVVHGQIHPNLFLAYDLKLKGE